MNKEAVEHLKELKTLRIEFPNALQEQAIDYAIKAIRIVEVIEDAFKNSSNLMMDSDDWEDIKEYVEGEP